MPRSVLLLLAGAMAGSAAVYLLKPSANPETASRSPALPELTAPTPSPATVTGQPGSGGFAAQRLAAYEEAANATDAFEVEGLIDLALDDPASRRRDLRVKALLARLAEFDARRAVEYARTRYLEPEFLVPVFEAWARSDPDAAIAELASITPPARQRDIALAILGVVGYDAEGIESVAAALPAAARVSFELDALLVRAEGDPIGVLRELLALPNSFRRSMALPRVAELAAQLDPQAALAQAAAIDDYPLRRSARDAVLSAWAGLDSEAAFEWLATAEIADLPESAAVYQTLAAADPDRLFALLDGLPPAIRTSALRAAMQALAETDAMAALARLDSMPPGQDRGQLLQTIAQTYGRQNPDLALAWARGLPPAEMQAAVRSVIRGILAVDPERAIDLVLADLESGSGAPTNVLTSGTALSLGAMSSDLSLLMTLSSLTGAAGIDFARVADRLLTVDNPQIRSVLSSTIGSWARQDPDMALRWALNNAERLDPAAFRQMAQGLAQTDANRAISLLDQLPPAQRPQWATGLAQQLAQNDPAGALNLIERFRGQPEYAGVQNAVAQVIARTDPPAAAALLRDVPTRDASAVLMVAREWSRRDPAAAADWAVGLSDPTQQRMALSQVATGWAERDPAAAESWLLGMIPGTQLDLALDSYVSAAAQGGRFNSRLLDAYSTPEAAQRGAARAIQQIGRSDQQEARRLLDAYITDETLRRQTEEVLARTGGTRSGSSIVTSGGIIF